MTRFHIVLEAPNVSAAVRIIIGPLAVLFIIFEVAYIFMAGQIRLGTPGQSPFSNHHVIAEIPHVYAAVCIGVGTLTVLLVVLERADIFITRQCRLGAPGFRTLPGFHIIREVPNIYAAVCIGVSALTVLLVVSEVTDVFITSQCCLKPPSYGALACPYITFEFASVSGSVGLGVSTLAVFFVIGKVTDIFIAGQSRL